MSSPPTIYFPENLRYRANFREGRRWNTVTSEGPTGRIQVRKRYLRPKRQIAGQIFPVTNFGTDISDSPFGSNEPGSASPQLTPDHIFALLIRPFLELVAGRFNPFYIFSTAPRAYYNIKAGGWNGGGDPLPLTWPDDLPFTLPFRAPLTGISGGQNADVKTITLRPVAGGPSLNYGIGDFHVDHGGGGQATRLLDIIPTISTDGPPIDDTPYNMFVSVDAAQERVPAEMVTDLEDLPYDFGQADPVQELAFAAEEYFG